MLMRVYKHLLNFQTKHDQVNIINGSGLSKKIKINGSGITHQMPIVN